MKERILTNWTFMRALYFLMGIAVIIQSVLSHQWFGVAFGGYFASMGLFAFGCAAGNCFKGSCAADLHKKTYTTTQDVDLEEIKVK
jgi:hypothetical protein